MLTSSHAPPCPFRRSRVKEIPFPGPDYVTLTPVNRAPVLASLPGLTPVTHARDVEVILYAGCYPPLPILPSGFLYQVQSSLWM